MRTRWLLALVILLLAGAACSRDPEVAKRKYLESGNRYFDKGKYNEASIMYRSALKKDARYGEAYYRLGLTALKLNKVVDAERTLRRAYGLLKDGKQKDDATTKLSDIYLVAMMSDTRRTKGYETLLKDFLGGLPERSFDRLRLEGYLAWRDKDADGALAKFAEARKLRPADPSINLAFAQVLLPKGRFDEAEAVIRDVIAKDKTNGSAYDLLYREYLGTKRVPEAEAIRKLKSENNPTVLEYRLQLAGHYFVSNRREEADRIVNAVLADPKTFPKARERVGDFYLTFRDFDKAVEVFKGGVGTKEEKLNFNRKIADVYILQGKRDQALALVENEILKVDPKDPTGLALRASLWLDAGNRNQLQQALSELETAVGKLPRNAVVRYNLGRAYWTKGDVEPARTQFRAALDLQPDYLAPRLALIQIQINRREFAQAVQASEEALQMNPPGPHVRMLHAQALQGIGKTAEARAEFQGLVKSAPESVEPRFRLGLLELSARNFTVAEQVFRECLQADKTNTLCQIGVAEVYSGQQQYDKAAEVLRAELKQNPDRRELLLALGNTCVQARKYPDAIEVYKRMIAKEPNSVDLNLRLAESYRRMGNVPVAIENFRRVKQLQPNNPDAAIWLALLLHQTGREADAKVEYEQILRLQSDNAVALNNLAYVIAEQGGDLDVALTYAQRAKQKIPQSLEISDTLGWIYLKKNLRTNALEIYDDIVRKAPQNPTFRYHLGMALFQQGNKPQAKKELETALRNRPSKDEEGKIRDLLQKIG